MLKMKNTKRKYIKYSVRKISIILLSMTITLLIFNSDGLLNWANSFEYGSTRNFWVSVITPFSSFSNSFNLANNKIKLKTIFKESVGLSKKETDIILSTNQIKTIVKVDSVIAEKIQINSKKSVFQNKLRNLGKTKSNKNPINVLLLGDSMMGNGLGVMLNRTFIKDPLFKSKRHSELSSGLNRIDIYDWYKNSVKFLDQKKYNILIVIFGTNDAQSIKENGKTYQFYESAWDSIYSSRINKFLDLVHKKVDVVCWLGLPQVRKKEFSKRLQKINRLVKSQIMEYPNTKYFSLNLILADSTNSYTSFGLLNNKNVKIRMDDGIHFTNNGGRVIAEQLIQKIKNDIFTDYPVK